LYNEVDNIHPLKLINLKQAIKTEEA